MASKFVLKLAAQPVTNKSTISRCVVVDQSLKISESKSSQNRLATDVRPIGDCLATCLQINQQLQENLYNLSAMKVSYECSKLAAATDWRSCCDQCKTLPRPVQPLCVCHFSAVAVYNRLYSKLSTNQKQFYICKSAIYDH